MAQNRRKSISERFIAILFFLLLLGSVFIVSARNYDLFETYRKFWSIIGIISFIILISVISIARKGALNLSLDSFFKAICLTGVLEAFFALFQFFKIMPSFNSFYAYTGSFENPAVFAMLLSFCVPIAVYYAFRSHRKILWRMIAVGLYVFICFSESRSGLLAATTASIIVLLLERDDIKNLFLDRRTLTVIIPISIAAIFLIYLFKADSANGRLLIWRVSFEMLKDKPLFGFGADGFLAHYMDYQADYLACHPTSPFMLLADNVNNPFNEFILILINYGVIGVLVLSGLIVLLFYRLNTLTNDGKSLLTGLTVALIIWSMFSYPYSMPFVWVLTLLILHVAFSPKNNRWKIRFSSAAVIICIPAMILAIHSFSIEQKWKKVAQRSLAGETETMITEYRKLYNRLHENGRFMYNYGAELHYSGHYEESLKILDECSTLLNDYDVQILIGDDCQQTGDTTSAIKHYNYANSMVPSRFLPQYYIMNLYFDMGDTVNAVFTAERILSNNVKVERSKSVQRILHEAEKIINQNRHLMYNNN